MTEQEWSAFAVEVEATFRGDLAEDRELALREHIGRLPLDVARACVRHMVLDEVVFMPAPGDFMRVLRSVVSQAWERRRLLLGLTVEEMRVVDAAQVRAVIESHERLALGPVTEER